MHVNELDYGGVQVIAATRLSDFRKLGHDVLLTYFKDGPVLKILEENGIPHTQVGSDSDLFETVIAFSPDVLHGHTCDQGTRLSPLIGELRKQIRFVYGETLHSIAKNEPRDDFNVVHTQVAKSLNPHATFIPWGMDTDRLTPTIGYEEYRRKWGIPKGALVIGRNSRLDGSKLPYQFLEVLSILKGMEKRENILAYGVLGGEGPERDGLLEYARNLNIAERLTVPGGGYNAGDILSGTDIIVYPTHDESFCAGVVEPMYLRKPVTCYLKGGMGQHVIHGDTALVASDARTLASHVLSLARNPEAAKRMADRAFNLCERLGYWDRMRDSKAHIEMYERSLEGRNGWTSAS